ncbi:DUF3883 domain-containing protein [Aquibium oceanicum]|uniref:Uncharacterized protein n=1 Tax=Aquibium oceanicum TaxID=1670800 RepID=A0A1L3SKT5_9HYPH|nr:DUF3883 domain-containing protein [Aquibium oceanicum]APH70034.1 hypothetical protein BSQ44_00545 [Aquibium oceanicum]
MSVDYAALRADNIKRYGTDIGRIGKMLLADRYDKLTHFIYELLQNAEDALRRRSSGWTGDRSVTFELSAEQLVVTHHGQPFNAADVQGVCGIDESTKDITSIGRFGIGFKSVYSFTKRPEIHSGDEDFAIETFVWPKAVAPVERQPSQTKIILPLNGDVEDPQTEIAEGLQDLGPRTLLFLRHIKEISWSVDGEPAGLYFRDDPKTLAPGIRQIALMGQQDGEEIEENWLVFSKEVANEGQNVGFVELAFALSSEPAPTRRIVPLSDSTLVVFFPTVLSTNTGFLLQGPFRTTPSRDNIPVHDTWNRNLVNEASLLLVEALRWMASERMLDVNALQALPIQKERFSGNLLAPMYDHLAEALQTEPLLPCGDSQHAAAQDVQLARTQDLRELFDADQLGNVLRADGPVRWLSADITADRTPALRHYLIHELGISEQSAESLLPRLGQNFLRAQSDQWLVRLYEYLNKVPVVAERLRNLALVRLEDGRQVAGFVNDMPQAFFPSDIQTGFPTIRRNICRSAEATKFLKWLGLTPPDPVDDVIRNLLPVYQDGEADQESYGEDIARILRAFKTDSATQRLRLITALTETPFVRARDMKTREESLKAPPDVSIKTARLSELYEGITGVYLTEDDSVLRGESVRELLEACGATRYILPVPVRSNLTETQKYELRLARGAVAASFESAPEDASLRGLDAILAQFPSLSVEARKRKARLVWEALIELQDRRGEGVFSGTYRWQYHQWRSASFDAHFVRVLNRSRWITDGDGDLVEPSSVLFEALGWPANPFLQSRIVFKKPIVEELAKEAGFEPDMLDMLKKLGVTSKADLLAKLKVEEPSSPDSDDASLSDEDDDRDEVSDDNEYEDTDSDEEQGSEDEDSEDDNDADDAGDENDGERDDDDDQDAEGDGEDNDNEDDGDDHHDDDDHDESENASSTSSRGDSSSSANRSQGAANRGNATKNDNKRSAVNQKPAERKFVSYVATHPDDEEERDPDGLDHSARMALEAKAITLIRKREPGLKPTPAGNKGFDLLETDANAEPERWVEVKAMKGCLEDRPVGLSSVQFEFARQHGDQYWLYVVEHADDETRARILKIKDPVGRSGTFIFDKGWASIAQVDAS